MELRLGPGDGSFVLILQVFRQNSMEPVEQDITVPTNLFFSLFGWCSWIDPGAAEQFASSCLGLGLAVDVPAALLCPFRALWRLDSKAREEWEGIMGLSGIWETKK